VPRRTATHRRGTVSALGQSAGKVQKGSTMQPVSVTEQEIVVGGINLSGLGLNMNLTVSTVTAAIPQVNINVLGNAIQTNYATLSTMFSTQTG
jgi:hypothetical protein